MGLALVHIVQLVPTFQTMQLLGVGYLLLIAGTVVVGARLIMGAPTRAQLWAPVAILGVGAMVAYAFTRVVSTPLDNQDVGNWACTLGMAALFLEAALVALSAYAIATRSRARQVCSRSATGRPSPTETSQPYLDRPRHFTCPVATAQGPTATCDSAAAGMAFRLFRQRRHPELHYFAAQNPSLHAPVSTRRPCPCGRRRMTRGHRGSLPHTRDAPTSVSTVAGH
jgi:hypothetical protein